MNFKPAQYRDNESGRYRWAVLGPCNVWYFPTRYGMRAASALARRMNNAQNTKLKDSAKTQGANYELQTRTISGQ